MSKKQKPCYTKVGGQAVIEGVMMRGIDKAGLAVRHTSGEIKTEVKDVSSLDNPPLWRKIPLLRGVITLIGSMTSGYTYLMRSMELSGIADEEGEDTPKEDGKKNPVIAIAGVIGMVLGLALAVVLFMFLPAWVSKFLGGLHTGISPYKGVIEGFIKIAVFVIYLFAVSRLKDIRRTFEYHGAEHKTIFCYEAKLPLTVENVKKQKRFHPRCGTSFMLISLIISILIFMFVTWNVLWIRVLLKIALMPVVVGCAYEIIRLAGKFDNVFTRIISAPGMWLQRLTTKEPDDKQIEVAIASLKIVTEPEETVEHAETTASETE
jgi:Predicted metal-dependent enzyme